MGWRKVTVWNGVNLKYLLKLNKLMLTYSLTLITSNEIQRRERWVRNVSLFTIHNQLGWYAVSRWYSEEYDWFYIDSETQFYTLHVSLTATGDAGDSINSVFQPGASSNGMPFSSKDADHDLSADNCAAQYLGGWWYNSCSSSKQLGTATSSNYMWNSLSKDTPPVTTSGQLTASRMMIRPINWKHVLWNEDVPFRVMRWFH